MADRPVDVPPAPTAGGPLTGVPFAVKELLAWPGLPWTMGSPLMAATPAPGLSPYAARIRDAGAAVLCSTTSSSSACWAAPSPPCAAPP